MARTKNGVLERRCMAPPPGQPGEPRPTPPPQPPQPPQPQPQPLTTTTPPPPPPPPLSPMPSIFDCDRIDSYPEGITSHHHVMRRILRAMPPLANMPHEVANWEAIMRWKD
ncbi:hypothetical protein PPROV_000483200 [Pycnococcus provasolii]|uniref:Uncharacterized protein n=1 Tax=Pycnococcus provasolii TaxID=41880 RepID=A0A830HGR5_9CHLO|nr:hypothetical protein PPROV_000483200 [Pycnococcus provasolii]